MTLLTNIETPSTSYHDALLKHFIESKCSSETTVLLMSGEQKIVVKAVLLRNASNFLKASHPVFLAMLPSLLCCLPRTWELNK